MGTKKVFSLLAKIKNTKEESEENGH